MDRRAVQRAISRTAAVAIIVALVIAAAAAYAILATPRPAPEQQATRPATVVATPSPTAPALTTPTTPTPTAAPASAKETLRVAIGVDLDTIDPHAQTTTTVLNVVGHVYETLLWYDPNGSLIPWLATSWEASPDGLAYTFKLRQGVKFHDGADFDAYAVKANIDRWLDPTARVPLRSQLGPVNGSQVVDKYTIRITLSSPYAPFLRALASYLLIASPDVLSKVGNATITDLGDAVGTGPYRLASWEKGKRVVLERFDSYWGYKPPIKRIEWNIIPEASTRLAALLAGDVDFAFNLPPTDLERVRNTPGFQVVAPTSNRVIFVGLVPKGPLADPRVRQALNYAIDKQAIINSVLYGLGMPLDSPVPQHFFGYSRVGFYEYSPEKAKQLLAQAGYPNGFKMVMIHPTGRYLQDAQVAQAIQAYLARLGIQVELKTMDWPSYVAEVLKPLDQKQYDAFFLGWGPGVADAHFTLYAMFHSSQWPPKGFNSAFYKNTQADQLLSQAMTELNESRRRELYAQASSIIWNDAPWIFLYTQKWFYGAGPGLKDFWIYVDGERVFFNRAYFS